MNRTLLSFLAVVFLVACTSGEESILAPLDAYLVENIAESSFGGKVFCAYDILAMDMRKDAANVYVWALCGEYFLADGTLTLGTASSLPVVISMKRSFGGYTITGYAFPQDGMGYMPSIRELFPASAIQAMCHEKPDCYNERAIRLEQTIQAEAMTSYGLK